MERSELARRMADHWLSCNGLSGRPTKFLSDHDPEACEAFRALGRDGENEVVNQALKLCGVVSQLEVACAV
ncbi:hypothetical protein EON81_09990 [bacterium]|nr:MAG: hypothetical protein EON81_09990 [bacterium]